MDEFNRVPDLAVSQQPLPSFTKVLIALSAFALFATIYMPLRAMSLFRGLGMAKTNSIGELFKKHNEDLFYSLSLPSFPMGMVLLFLIYLSLEAMSDSTLPKGRVCISLFLVEIVAALNIAYLCVNKTKSSVHAITKPSAPRM